MTRPLPERFHELLPAIYRQRDLDEGEPLRALLAVLEQEFERVRANIETTYDNWFIETCERWLVPYIGALVGADDAAFAGEIDARAYVANSIAYRRRRGTALVLEQLAQDLTGHGASAVEYFQRVLVHAHIRHVREQGNAPLLGGTVDLRDAARLEHFGGPHDRQAHRAEVRRAASGRGRYNIPHLGLHLWRVRSVELTRCQAKPIAGAPNFFRVDPWGHDRALFHRPRTEVEISSLATELNLPLPLRRRELAADLERTTPLYLGEDPVIAVRLSPDAEPLTPVIGNLSGTPNALTARPSPGQAIIDPELGRIVLHDDDLPSDGLVFVDYSRGEAGELGCGPWDRSESLVAQLADLRKPDEQGALATLNNRIDWRCHVASNASLAGEIAAVANVEAAVLAWNTFVASAAPGAVGLIVLLGGRTRTDLPPITSESRRWAAPSSTIVLPRGARLYIVAAGVDVPATGPLVPVPVSTQAILEGQLRVSGGSHDAVTRPGGLFLNGVGLTAGIEVLAGQLGLLSLASCTIHPDTASITVAGLAGQANAALTIELVRCVCGRIETSTEIAKVRVDTSIVQGASKALALTSALEVTGSTLLGTVDCRIVDASDSIFAGTLRAEQHQQGCLRYCHVPTDGQTPRPYRCQPRLALEGITQPDAQLATRQRLAPTHVSERFGEPGYGLLAPHAAAELHTGAENGSAIGVFNHLQHAQREAQLLQALDRYLRFGLEAGLFLES